MSTKLVYLYDANNGRYIEPYLAQSCPIEKDVFHTPVHSTEIEPPKVGENEFAVFAHGGWQIEKIEPIEISEDIISDEDKIRQKRNGLILWADIEINKLEDCGKDATEIRKFRQLLREVPQQKGFPKKIRWPKLD